MGTECHILAIRKEIREQIGKTFGDESRSRWNRISKSA
jgi:hypothetical protein